MKPYHRNPRQITNKRYKRLQDTLARLGDLSGIVHNLRTDEVIGGNQRAAVFGNASEVVIVERYGQPDEQGTIAHGFVVWRGKKYAYRLVDWDDETAAEANLAANIGAGDWDWDVFANAWEPEELTAWGFDGDLLADWGRDYSNLAEMLGAKESDQEPDDAEIGDDSDYEFPLAQGVPDALWPSDNRFGIPALNIERQGDAVELPVEVWGAKRRGTGCGTLVFYTEDYRFRALWENPLKVLKTGADSFVEPNFSIYQNFPLAIALYRTYQKRWLARYWQSLGMRCFVDLNVNPNYYDVNLLGVPKGWRAWATRGYTDRLEYTEQELAMAKQHAETDDILFLVYGGGKKVMEWCENNGAVWISEDMDRAKGLYAEALYG